MERVFCFFVFLELRWVMVAAASVRRRPLLLFLLLLSHFASLSTKLATGPGTRPGPGGAPFISTGVAGLDSALGGGLPLGRLLLLEESSSAAASSTTDALSRLFVAEGVACGQRVAWVQSRSFGGGCDDDEDSEQEKQRWWIPGRAVARGSERASSSSPRPPSASPSPSSGNGAAAAAPRGGNEDFDEGSDLKIAWQYRRYIASARVAREEEEQRRKEKERAERRQRRQEEKSRGGGGGNASNSPHSSSSLIKAWCHDFDLTKRTLCPGFGKGSEASCSSPSSSSKTPLLVAAETLAAAADAAVAAARASTADLSLPPARIFVSDPGSPEWTMAATKARTEEEKDYEDAPSSSCPSSSSSSTSVLLLLRRLRGALRGARAAAVVTVRAGSLSPSELDAARATADAVISISPLRVVSAVVSSEGGHCLSNIHSSSSSSSSLIAGAGKNGSAVALARVVRLPPAGPAVPSRPQPCSGSSSSLKSPSAQLSGVLLVVSRKKRTLSVAPAVIDHDAEEAAAATAANSAGGSDTKATASCGARPGSRSAAALEF